MNKRAALALFVLAGMTLAGGAVYGALGDLVFERKQASQPGAQTILPAIFPHWVHRVRFRCYVCHPAPFKMKQGATEITMTAIQKGQFCGACHNGQIAFNVEFTSCSRCHREPDE